MSSEYIWLMAPFILLLMYLYIHDPFQWQKNWPDDWPGYGL